MDNLIELLVTRHRRPVYYNIRYVPGVDTMMDFFDVILEEEILRQTMDQSMDTYNEELFKQYDGEVLIQSPKCVLNEEEVKCFICLEDVHKDTEVYDLPCNHYFHCECIEGAVKRRHARCPLCRKAIPLLEK